MTQFADIDPQEMLEVVNSLLKKVSPIVNGKGK